MKKLLGISGRDRDAAAALSVDGKIVAAVAEESFARVPGIGYARTGGFPHAAVNACLDVAGLEPEDVGDIVIVDDGGTRPTLAVNGRFRGIPVHEMAAERADALHAVAANPKADLVLVCGSEPTVMASFQRNGERLGPRVEFPGADGLVRAARKLAGVLGLPPADPFASLDRLSIGSDPDYQTSFEKALQWRANGSIELDDSELSNAVVEVSGEFASSLADGGSLNARLLSVRRSIAASFMCLAADLVGRAATHAAERCGASSVAAGGALFANARFNTELARSCSRLMSVASVPEAVGRAAGAAASASTSSPGGVALGPVFTEEDIKRTLDNCRLDYVYEPDWPRLLERVSRMLAQGKVVAWFQGAMAFGPRAMGTRTILADPSGRYARQNMNQYLRQAPIDEPLPVALAASMEEVCLAHSGHPSRGTIDRDVRAEWRTKFSGALDWRHHVRVHGGASDLEPRLRDLLELHHRLTGTPGLITANLSSPSEPVVCTPRDAVRTVYSSAIDALVIGRFLLMKDYWLLRSQE